MDKYQEFNNLLETTDKDELLTECKKVIDKWYNININDPLNIITNLFKNFHFNNEDLKNQIKITDTIREEIRKFQILKLTLDKFKLLKIIYDEENLKTYDEIFTNLIYNIGNLRLSLLFLRKSVISLNPLFDCSMEDNHLIQSINILDTSEMHDNELLIRYTLNHLYLNEYRKYGNYIFEPIYYNNYFTHAWKKKYEIKDYVNSFLERDTDNNKMWGLLYVKKNVDWLVKYLTDCKDIQFPKIEKNRYYFSFRNGIYNIKDHEFFPYNEIQLPLDIVSCKFFDKDFEFIKNFENWENIQTNSVQLILNPQFKDEEDYKEICKLVYILFGRLLYNLGECDDWQVLPFFKGTGGAGKSTLLRHLIKNFYDAVDVGILSNDCSNGFPIENLVDKKIFIALDIDNSFKLPQMQFQSMVSGEDVSINRKFKDPLDIVWNIPGALSGNELFGYRDNAGSLARRIIVFQFNKRITGDDLKIDVKKELDTEFPIIIQKCNLAYQWAIKNYDMKDIWSYLPPYFTKNSNDLLEQSNSLVDFMKNGNLVYDKNAFMSKSDFGVHYNQYCKENNCISKKLTRDTFSGSFSIIEQIKNIKIELKVNPMIDGIKKSGTFIIGLDLAKVEHTECEF